MNATLPISEIPKSLRQKFSIPENCPEETIIEVTLKIVMPQVEENIKKNKSEVSDFNTLMKKGKPQKQHTLKDMEKFTFKGNPKNGNNLATTYKEYLYGDKSKWAKY